MAEHVEGRIKDKLDLDEDTFTEEEQEKYQQYLIEKNEELGREFKTIEEGIDALAAIPIEDLEGYNSLETLKEAGILDILKENGIERPTLNDIAESLGISPQQGLDMSKYIQYCIENGYSYQNVLGGDALEASYYDSTLSSLPRLSMEDYINKTNLGEEEANRLESLQTSVNIRQTGQQIVEVGGAIIGLTGGNVDTDIADFDKVDDIAKLADDVQDVGKLADVVDNSTVIVDVGIETFNNFDINTAYVKPKHLSTSGGKGAKFLGDTKESSELILREALQNGNIKNVLDNGLTSKGNHSYEIIIDAGKPVGTKGEEFIKIILSEDGGMLSAYPIK